jgi:hypothetical protein
MTYLSGDIRLPVGAEVSTVGRSSMNNHLDFGWSLNKIRVKPVELRDLADSKLLEHTSEAGCFVMEL